MGRRDRRGKGRERPDRDRSRSPPPREYRRESPVFTRSGRSRSISPSPRRNRERSTSRDRRRGGGAGLSGAPPISNGRSLLERIGNVEEPLPLAARLGRQERVQLPPQNEARQWDRDGVRGRSPSPKPKFRPIGQQRPQNPPTMPPPSNSYAGASRGRKKSLDEEREDDRKRPRLGSYTSRPHSPPRSARNARSPSLSRSPSPLPPVPPRPPPPRGRPRSPSPDWRRPDRSPTPPRRPRSPSTFRRFRSRSPPLRRPRSPSLLPPLRSPSSRARLRSPSPPRRLRSISPPPPRRPRSPSPPLRRPRSPSPPRRPRSPSPPRRPRSPVPPRGFRGRSRSPPPPRSRLPPRSISPEPPRPPRKPQRLRSRSPIIRSSISPPVRRHEPRPRRRADSIGSRYDVARERGRPRARSPPIRPPDGRHDLRDPSPRARRRSPSTSRSRASSRSSSRGRPARSLSPEPPVPPKPPARRRNSFEAKFGPPPQPPKPPKGPRASRAAQHAYVNQNFGHRQDGPQPPAYPASMAQSWRGQQPAPSAPRQWRTELENAPKGPRSRPSATTSPRLVSEQPLAAPDVQPALPSGAATKSFALQAPTLATSASAGVRRFFPDDDEDVSAAPLPPSKRPTDLPPPLESGHRNRRDNRDRSRSPPYRRRNRPSLSPASEHDRKHRRSYHNQRYRSPSMDASRYRSPPRRPMALDDAPQPPSPRQDRMDVNRRNQAPSRQWSPASMTGRPPSAIHSRPPSPGPSAATARPVVPADGQIPPLSGSMHSTRDQTPAIQTEMAPPIAAIAEMAAPASAVPAKAGSKEVYERLVQVGEGTYGKVYKARDIENGALVAMKRIRMEAEKDGFPVTSIREIKLLQGLRHVNIVNLIEMVVSKGHVYMIFEYMDHDLSGILHHPNITFTEAHVKSLMWQLLSGLAYMHEHSVLHRDLKGSNILLNKAGELKIADFGLARRYERGREPGREGKGRGRDYTNRVITLWYKPPELLLGATIYGEEVDIWSAGAIFLELFTRRPVFQATDEIEQLHNTLQIIGTPTPNTWPLARSLPWYDLVKPKEELPCRLRDLFFGPDKAVKLEGAMQVAEALLTIDPARRPSARQAMESAYFTTDAPEMELPSGPLSSVEGEWHELESKKARKARRGGQ